MAHTIRKKQKLIHRVRRLRGQVEAIERALVSEMACSDIPRGSPPAGAPSTACLGEVIEDHVRFHVIERHRHRGSGSVEVGEELIEATRTYLR
jgi:DNA-binding FrmR family transcriptional regulator